MRTGDERYLPARDKGPVRRFIRDYVDSRFSFIELMIPLLMVVDGPRLHRQQPMVHLRQRGAVRRSLLVIVVDMRAAAVPAAPRARRAVPRRADQGHDLLRRRCARCRCGSCGCPRPRSRSARSCPSATDEHALMSHSHSPAGGGPSADVSVRVAWADDAAAIAAVQVAGMAGALRRPAAGRGDCRPTWTPSPSSGARSLARRLTRATGCWSPSSATASSGFAMTSPAADPDCDPVADGELAELTVDPAERAKGHGSRLLQAAVDTLVADRFTRAVTWVDAGDDALRTFLTDAGWAPDSGPPRARPRRHRRDHRQAGAPPHGDRLSPSRSMPVGVIHPCEPCFSRDARHHGMTGHLAGPTTGAQMFGPLPLLHRSSARRRRARVVRRLGAWSAHVTRAPARPVGGAARRRRCRGRSGVRARPRLPPAADRAARARRRH